MPEKAWELWLSPIGQRPLDARLSSSFARKLLSEPDDPEVVAFREKLGNLLELRESAP